MNRTTIPTIPYIMALLAVTCMVAFISLYILRSVAGEWADSHRMQVGTIVGAFIIAPWLVAIVRMRRPV
jgi:hypothetical protein